MNDHQHQDGKHEHGGFSSMGMFDDRKVLQEIGVSEGQTFLDAGCADGHFSIEASKIVGKTGKVIAVDNHRPSLEKLINSLKMEKISNIEILEHDLTEPLQLSNSILDHFFISNVLHGFTFNGEIDPVIQNMKKLLKRGGLLSVIEWDKDNVVHGPPLDHRISYDEVKDIIGPHGFMPVEVSHITNEHVLMLFRSI